MTTQDLREDRAALFRQLVSPETLPRFFARVADDVRWTVLGTHPLAGTYPSKTAFVSATFARLAPLMREGTHLELTHLCVDEDTAIAELTTASTTLEGAPYDNRLCWVCRFAGSGVGDEIIEVRAYLDSALLAWTVARNESRP